jgi:hypothetical protein
MPCCAFAAFIISQIVLGFWVYPICNHYGMA